MAECCLVLLVAYKNMEEVDAFIDHIRPLFRPGSLSISVCDNSRDHKESRFESASNVTMVHRPDNPGYLEGGLVALEAYRASGGEADWIVLTNTDLSFQFGNPCDLLASSYDSSEPLVIAPRVTEGAQAIEKNPHVLSRRSQRRLRLNHALTATPWLSLGYLTASALRRRWGKGAIEERRSSEGWAAKFPQGTRFYSPYGAIVIFSRGFFEAGGLPRNVPLLSEEYFIAEAAAELDAPVIYDPRIHVHHVAHATTGPRVTLRRARMASKAFAQINTDSQRRGAVPK